MVLSNVLHRSSINGVKGGSHSLYTSSNVNRVVLVTNSNNKNFNYKTSNSSASLCSNAFYYNDMGGTLVYRAIKLLKL